VSLVGYDLVMSLDPHWHSTLFGAYFFVGSFYAGLAALMVMTVLAVKKMGMGAFIKERQFHDLGKLIFGFGLLTGDFFYAQFLVIWYGNLPEETQYVILRVREAPWGVLAWTVLVAAFAVPFFVLLNRKIKMRPIPMIVLSVVILAGMWLERLLLVAPALWKGRTLPLGVMEVMITLGFLGLVSLCTLWFLKKFPVLPISDPLFREASDQ